MGSLVPSRCDNADWPRRTASEDDQGYRDQCLKLRLAVWGIKRPSISKCTSVYDRQVPVLTSCSCSFPRFGLLLLGFSSGLLSLGLSLLSSSLSTCSDLLQTSEVGLCLGGFAYIVRLAMIPAKTVRRCHSPWACSLAYRSAAAFLSAASLNIRYQLSDDI